jgi:hypothetical protein
MALGVPGAGQEEHLVHVPGGGQEHYADGDHREPRLPGRDATRDLGLLPLDLLRRQRLAVLEAAASVVLDPAGSTAPGDSQYGEEGEQGDGE